MRMFITLANTENSKKKYCAQMGHTTWRLLWTKGWCPALYTNTGEGTRQAISSGLGSHTSEQFPEGDSRTQGPASAQLFAAYNQNHFLKIDLSSKHGTCVNSFYI